MNQESIQRKYLFGAVNYTRAGSCSILTVLGVKVYMTCGSARWLIGYTWKAE